ncbi:MAG: CaiB/BaiF CoA transferase family protein [Hyphomicrobiales bacterium]
MGSGADTGKGPLSDITVLEFAQVIAIPMCGLVLSDMGARVIKVEPPTGDSARSNMSPIIPGESKSFAVFNRGKESVCLDLTRPETRPVVERLVKSADVVLVSFKPPDVERYGLSYESLSRVNPRIVYLEHLPLGRKGRYADIGGYDVIVQGLSGLGAITGAPGDAPRNVNPAYADHATGFISALAVVAALRHRDRTGEGQRVETSLLSTALALGGNLLHWFGATDPDVWESFARQLKTAREAGGDFAEQQRIYTRTVRAGGFANVYFRHYRTKDGIISVGALSQPLIRRFREVTGLHDPRTDPDFELGTPEAFARLGQLIEEAEALFRTKTTEEWITAFHAAGVPAGPFLFPQEVFGEPQVVDNGYLVELEHPLFGPYKTFAPPLRMEATPVWPQGASPLLDSGTDDVLAGLGFSGEEIAQLREAGVIGARPREEG